MPHPASQSRRSFIGAAVGVAASLVKMPFVSAATDDESLRIAPDQIPMPELSGAVGWLNSTPMTNGLLRGKVVLVDFWTYTCINSLRQLPYVRSWAAKYERAGLVVIGVHTPEFAFEKALGNVGRAVRDLAVAYPVAIDSNYSIWQAFRNRYWPADYFIDAKGRIRHTHFGEGDYAMSERVIRELLTENGATSLPGIISSASGLGVEAPPDFGKSRSPETYIGYDRAEHFASPERVLRGSPTTYSSPPRLSLNQWALTGRWTVGSEGAVLQTSPGKIQFRFHSRDLHLVLAPAKNEKAIRFATKLDGAAPGADCGIDTSADGNGEIREPRLYQLIRHRSAVRERTFEIEFLDPGAQACAFTFG